MWCVLYVWYFTWTLVWDTLYVALLSLFITTLTSSYITLNTLHVYSKLIPSLTSDEKIIDCKISSRMRYPEDSNILLSVTKAWLFWRTVINTFAADFVQCWLSIGAILTWFVLVYARFCVLQTTLTLQMSNYFMNYAFSFFDKKV